MFTHLFQIFLVIIVTGIVIATLDTWLQDRREARAIAREIEAIAYADRLIQERIDNGCYDNLPEALIDADFDRFVDTYLTHNK